MAGGQGVIYDSGGQGSSGPDGARVFDGRVQTDANLQIANVDVGAGNPVPITIAAAVPVTVVQPTHDLLNCNANVQQGNVDVGPGNPLSVDGAFSFPTSVDVTDHVHGQIHLQQFFTAQSFTVALAALGVDDIHVLTGALGAHMQFSAKARQDCQVQLFEAPTTTLAGAAVLTSCRTRVPAPPVPQTVVTLNPTVTVVGLLLADGWIGGNLLASHNPHQDPTGMMNEWSEWVLAPNTAYLFRVTNNLVAGATLTQQSLNWYETA